MRLVHSIALGLSLGGILVLLSAAVLVAWEAVGALVAIVAARAAQRRPAPPCVGCGGG